MLVCDLLKLKKEKNSFKSIDAHKGKINYQIKSRWFKGINTSGQNEFGRIKQSNDKYPFDYLILVYFNKQLSNYKIFQIDSSYINSLSMKKNKFIYLKKENGNKYLLFKYNKALEDAAKEEREVKLLYDKKNNKL